MDATLAVGDLGMLLLDAASRLAVRAAVVAQGLSNDRPCLGDPKLQAIGRGDATWAPQVKLSLESR